MRNIFSLLLSATCVAAHGFVHRVIIDGTTYIGNLPNGVDANPSIVRQINAVDPVKGADNPYLNCGQDAQLASLVANAMPGSTISFDWRGGDLSFWPHNIGPMMTYMASCGNITCGHYNSTQAKWFLINEVGQFPNGTWAQNNLKQGSMATVQLPSDLTAGNYLIRHEIIALHLANEMGGAEFYPSCTQLRVGGSQTGTPLPTDLVSLPGAYKDTDPGLYDPDVFNVGANYTFPGPPVASFITASGTSTGSPSPSSTPPASTSSPSGSCRLRRKGTTTNATNSRRSLLYHRQIQRPRSFSRIMRSVIFGDHSYF
ncbi:hypothetical protein APHAL10511_008402 [Amanita phalloides]|nr:hypothetical protein APHAL10511_008402 [Amanita phalloides]